MIGHGNEAFDEALGDAVLSIKVPGVHWRMSDNSMPRSAEVCAGVIESRFQYVKSEKLWYGPGSGRSGGVEYDAITGTVPAYGTTARDYAVYFTCLEMNNAPAPPGYSLAKSLVFWISQSAARNCVVIKGENALAGSIGTDTSAGMGQAVCHNDIKVLPDYPS